MAIRVMLVDDHAVVRDGIQMIIDSQDDMKVVAAVGDGDVAVAQAEVTRPDIVVMDIAMPGRNGIEAARAIIHKVPVIRIIMLSMHDNPEYVRQSMDIGSVGYVLKQSAGIEIIKAIRTVVKGHCYFGKGVQEPNREIASTGNSQLNPLGTLSKREREILRHIVEGKTSGETAEILFLSCKTIETYRSRLMKKLGINNIPTLVRFALRHGVIFED